MRIFVILSLLFSTAAFAQPQALVPHSAKNFEFGPTRKLSRFNCFSEGSIELIQPSEKQLNPEALARSKFKVFGRVGYNQLVYEIRNPKTDAVHFRQALERIGEYLALDVLEELNTEEVAIQTLTGTEAKHALVTEAPVLVTILRAGLPLNAGVQRVFPNSEVGFLAMSRNEETLKAKLDYVALPDMKGKAVIISDTMLATGGSLVDAIKILEEKGPKQIYVIAAIAAKPGIERITKYNPKVKIYAAAIDPNLNEKGFIIPGLGDAGDRSYGKKQR